MATLALGKIYQNGNLVNLRTNEIYDPATKQYVSQFIANTNTAIAGLESSIAGKAPVKVVADNAARDVLTNVINGDLVWSLDASADSTVTSGAACYLAQVSGDPATVTWTKVAEAESMDLVLRWGDIQDKPSSTVAAIDQAVTDSHTHTNATVLDAIGKDSTSNNLTFNGVELGGFTGTAVGASLAAANDYTAKLQIVVEDFDPEA